MNTKDLISTLCAENIFGLGHRKSYIALGISGQIIAMALAPLISVQHGLNNFAILALIASISLALYDTCTDGLALDITPENERGIVQGAMVGARAAGNLLILVIGGALAEWFRWNSIFYTISFSSLNPLLLLFIS